MADKYLLEDMERNRIQSGTDTGAVQSVLGCLFRTGEGSIQRYPWTS